MLNVVLARKRRRWLELTQVELAERLGVASETISRWENGEQEPRAGQLLAWARELELPVTDLLTEPEPEPAAEEVAG